MDVKWICDQQHWEVKTVSDEEQHNHLLDKTPIFYPQHCKITAPVKQQITLTHVLYPTYNGFIKTVIYHYQYLKTAYKLWVADILIFPHLDSD